MLQPKIHGVGISRYIWMVCLRCRVARPFTHSPTHALAHSFTHSLMHSLTHSITHPLTHSLTRSLNRSLPPSLTHSLGHSLTHSLTHSRTIHGVRRVLLHSANHDVPLQEGDLGAHVHSAAKPVRDRVGCTLVRILEGGLEADARASRNGSDWRGVWGGGGGEVGVWEGRGDLGGRQ